MSQSSPELPGNICKVIAHQARNVLYKGKDESNNAFVTFTLNKNKFATSVLEKTQNPVWNEECEFVIADIGGTLELVVCHSDFLREQFLGRVEISLSGVAATYGKSIRKWYKLQPKKGKEAKKLGDRGQLEVTVQILYREDVQQQVKGQEKKPALLNILPSPAWRRKHSGSSPDVRRKDSRQDSANEDYLNDINREMQFNEPAFYSDDSQSVASSMSDDFRTMYHHQHSHPDVVDQARDLRLQPSTPPTQKPPPSNRFRPGGVSGSARGKGGIGRNVKNALGNISKALSKEHLDKVGVSTPDLRYMSSSLPPTPIHEHQHHDRHGTSAPDEPDSGFRNAGVHLGVSSLGGALLAPPAALSRAVSEESLLKEKEEKEKKDVHNLTSLQRGKHVKRENRHKKALSACITLEEFGPEANKGSVTPDLRKEIPESKDKHGKHSCTSKYDTLSKQQLVHLVQQQESILSDNIQQIKELETYIEKLLLRVMVESPQLLDINRPIKF